MVDPLRHHREHRDAQPSVAVQVAQKIAAGVGTVRFLVIALGLIVTWIIVNGGYAYFSGALHSLEHGHAFDPAPWILLNLIFSFEAFFTGSLVIIAQGAQMDVDRKREAADAKHREEIAQAQSAALAQNTELTREVHELTRQIHQLTCRKSSTGNQAAQIQRRLSS